MKYIKMTSSNVHHCSERCIWYLASQSNKKLISILSKHSSGGWSWIMFEWYLNNEECLINCPFLHVLHYYYTLQQVTLVCFRQRACRASCIIWIFHTDVCEDDIEMTCCICKNCWALANFSALITCCFLSFTCNQLGLALHTPVSNFFCNVSTHFENEIVERFKLCYIITL